MISIKRRKQIAVINITPKYSNELYDITSIIELKIKELKHYNGLVNIHIMANTAAILIQENGESQLNKDFTTFFQQLINSYLYNYPIFNINNDARIKASIIGPCKTIPVIKGKLALSESQKVFLCEFDGPRKTRKIVISIISF